MAFKGSTLYTIWIQISTIEAHCMVEWGLWLHSFQSRVAFSLAAARVLTVAIPEIIVIMDANARAFSGIMKQLCIAVRVYLQNCL